MTGHPQNPAQLARRVGVPGGGALALVLHTHMPYVEGGAPWPRPTQECNPLGFGTWPFGEEWLWEAIATSYVPLLGVLGRAPLTLSLTPVLCDQLESPGALERCLRFLTEVRPESHRRDIDLARERGQDELVPELERSATTYASAAEELRALPDGLLGALGPHAGWTSAATHAGDAASGQRRGRHGPVANRRGVVQAPVRGLARRALAARVRVRVVARLGARPGWGPGDLRRAPLAFGWPALTAHRGPSVATKGS